MKLSKYIPAAVLAILAILCVCISCLGQTAHDQFIPISEPKIPAESVEKAEAKCQALLKFFKTPTKQFMPLGFYAMAADMQGSEKLKTLRRRGIILFHKYSSTQTIEDALADLRSAREAGVGILQNLPRTYLDSGNAIYNATDSAYFNAKEIEFWQHHITALAGNDQILVWYLPEEAKAKELDKLEQIGNIIRATDTKHRPIITYVQNERPEYLKRVGSITDTVVFGAYPSLYGERPRIEIKRRIDWVYKNGVPVVIAALEAIKGKFNWTRPKDVRFDAYLALISGAKGIMWYAYYYAKPRPELLEAVLEVADELNGPEGLGEVLLSGRKPKTLTCEVVEGKTYFHSGYPYDEPSKLLTSIQWTAQEYKNYLYIFAVNTAQIVGATDDGGPKLAIKVKFGPVNNASSEAEVISEKRTISLANNYFADTFEPLGTHIYKIKLN